MSFQSMKSLELWKRRPVRILAVLTALLLLPCFIHIIWPNKVYQCEEEYVFSEGTAVAEAVVYDHIALKPGVYRVELCYDAVSEGTEPVAYTTMQDGTVITGGLCTNGEHLYAGKTQTGYGMWLYEGTEHMQMTVGYEGRGHLRLSGYRIVETNQLWSMFITVILFAAALIFVVLTFFYYDRKYRVSPEVKKAVFFVSLISFLGSLPYLPHGGCFAGIDITFHMLRIEGVKDGLLSGQFPVRIEPEWVYGHGYPAALFYCNIFLYFPALLRMLGFTVSAVYNIYCIALTIATAVIAYQCFRRIFQDVNVGLLCCMLYTLSTFRIYKLVNTCAVGEASAVTFMPLVLYGLYRVFTEDPEDKRYKTAWLPIAFGYAGLIQTHVLTCEITAFLTLLVCILGIRKILCKNTFWELAKGALAAFAISLWFLVPFLDFYLTQNVHIKNLSARTIQRTGMTLAHLAFHFWRNGSYTPNGETGVMATYPVGLGLVLVLGWGIFCILWFSGAFRNTTKEMTFLARFSALFGGLLAFMSTNLFPWDRISAFSSLTALLVSSLEFTHRVLGWGTLFLVTVCGFCLWYFRRENRGYYVTAATVAVTCIITSSLYLLDFTAQNSDRYRLYNAEGMGSGFISDGEYLLEGTDPGKLTYQNYAVADRDVHVKAYDKNYLKARMSCANYGTEPEYVDLPMLYYRGYRAVDTATGKALEVCAGDNNVVRVILPQGFDGDVAVRFVSPFYWRVSEIVSAATLLFLVFGFLRRKRGALWKK